MKARNNNPSLEDIVFKGRNQDYGAYPLRKSYNRRLFFSFIYTLGIVIVLFIYPFMDLIYPMLSNRKPITTINSDSYTASTYFVKSEDEQAMGAAASSENKAPVVVQEKSISVTQTNLNETATGTTDSTGQSTTGNAKSGTGISDNSSSEGNDKILGSAEVNPSFPGGAKAMQAFIRENLHHPESARNVRGTILVYVVIMSNGSLRDVKVIRGLQPELDAEAVRVVQSMPLWNPAMQDGIAVNVRCTLPIVF